MEVWYTLHVSYCNHDNKGPVCLLVKETLLISNIISNDKQPKWLVHVEYVHTNKKLHHLA